MKSVLFKHRSIRKFRPTPIPEEVLRECLEAASRASTCGNMQLYSLVVTRDETLRERLAPCHFNQPMVRQAPCVVTVCADIHRFTMWCEQRDADPAYDNFAWFLNASTDALLAAHYPLARRVISLLGSRIRHLGDSIRNLVVCSVEGRLIKLLIALVYDLLPDAEAWRRPVTVPLRISQEQLASMAGTTQPTVSDLLQKLQKEGQIRVERRRITLLHPLRLLSGVDGMTVTSAMKGLYPATYDTLTDVIVNGNWDKYVGKIATLGLVSGTDPEANYVQIPMGDGTQWSDSFTQDDYKAMVKDMFDGKITVSNNTSSDVSAADFATVITVDDQGSIKG